METAIEVMPRSDRGKGAARKIRAAGKVPAILYGPTSTPRAVSVDPEALVAIFDQSRDRNTVVRVQLEGNEISCLVREVQRNPLTREILHVDFYAVGEGAEVNVKVPLVAVGKPKGALLGGRVRIIRREVRTVQAWNQIPRQIEVDVSPLDIGDMIKASALVLPEGVRLERGPDFAVVSLDGKGRDRSGGSEAAKA